MLLMLLLSSAPGCCGLFQPNVGSVRGWAKREISPGTNRVDAVRIIESHGLKITDSDAGKIFAVIFTGQCINYPPGYAIDMKVMFDSHQRVREVNVNEATILYDGSWPF